MARPLSLAIAVVIVALLAMPSSGSTAASSNRPYPPAHVSAIPGPSCIVISWQPPTSDGGTPVTGYRIYEPQLDYFGHRDDELLATVGATARNFTISGLAPFEYRSYCVAAINQARSSDPSPIVWARLGYTVPGPPTLFEFYEYNHKIDFYFNYGDPGGCEVQGMHVYRGNSTQDLKLVAVVFDSYSDTTAHNGVYSTYVVRAFNALGESADSQPIVARALWAPKNVTAYPPWVDTGDGPVPVRLN